MTPNPRRRGYALIAVILFVTLYLGLWSVAARQVSILLRIEQARANRIALDATAVPALEALAQGLAALEVGYPPANPYVVGTSGSGFTLVYTRLEGGNWSVQALPSADAPDPTDPAHATLDPTQFQPTPP
jgi:hypothetical protein